MRNAPVSISRSVRVQMVGILSARSFDASNTASRRPQGNSPHRPQFGKPLEKAQSLTRGQAQGRDGLQPSQVRLPAEIPGSRRPILTHSSRTLSSAAGSPEAVALNLGHAPQSSPQTPIIGPRG